MCWTHESQSLNFATNKQPQQWVQKFGNNHQNGNDDLNDF